MRLRPPTLPRTLLAAVFVCGLVMAPAGAAFAHTGSSTSDYRFEITGWVGDHRGVDLRIIELGNRVELRRTTASTAWGVAALLVLGVAAVIVFVQGAVRAVAPIAAVGSAVTVLGQGTSTLRQLFALAYVGVALCALALRRHRLAQVPALAAAAGATILAATRLDVFNHELVAGCLLGEPQRVTIAVGAGLCIGTLASSLVGAFGPTPEPRGAS